MCICTSISLSLSIYIYIYENVCIYIYIYIQICIYIYITRERGVAAPRTEVPLPATVEYVEIRGQRL